MSAEVARQARFNAGQYRARTNAARSLSETEASLIDTAIGAATTITASEVAAAAATVGIGATLAAVILREVGIVVEKA